MNATQNTTGAIPGLIQRVAPFFLPFVLFQIAPLLIVSPIPLFVLTLRNRPIVSLAALLGNTLLISLKKDPSATAFAGFFWLGVGVLFPFLIRKTGKVQQSAAWSYLFLVAVLLSGFAVLGHQAGMGPAEYVRAQISLLIDEQLLNPNSPVKELIADQGKEGLYRKLMTELPSGILITLLLSLWMNLLFASQFLKAFLSNTFWSQYRNPPVLVWPTLACGFLYAFSEHAPYLIGLNGFKLAMVLYALQGLSILVYLLNRKQVYGFLRLLILGLSVTAATPVIISLGFFDLWFDFRRKFGQI
jgi:uncharacterized protein YybS (DUF2232 family)